MFHLQLRRGPSVALDSYVGRPGEVMVDTTNETLRLFDGVTMGGVVLAQLMDVPTEAELTDLIKSYVNPAEDRANQYTDYQKTVILNSIIKNEPMIVESDMEADYHKGEEQDFHAVFNDWIRFSHLDGERPFDPLHLEGWEYDEVDEVVISTLNSPSTVGFVSPEKYEDYVFDVVVNSDNADDDLIGLVLAYAVDSEGVAHTITAMRTPGGIGHNAEHINDGVRELFQIWMNVSDGGNTKGVPVVDLGTHSRGLIWGDTGLVDEDRNQTSDVGSWLDWNGVRIRVERNGDHFKVMTSQLGERTFVEEATVEFTLNDHPELGVFRGPQSVGYVQHSQEGSYYETNARPILVQQVFDRVNGVLWDWDGAAWSATQFAPDETPATPHRFYYNDYFERLYLSDNAGLLHRMDRPDMSNVVVSPTIRSIQKVTEAEYPTNPDPEVLYIVVED